MIYIHSDRLIEDVGVFYDSDGLKSLKNIFANGGMITLDAKSHEFYPKQFSKLEICIDSGKLKIEFSGDSILIRGASEVFEILEANLSFISSGAHYHLENFENHFLLDLSWTVSMVFYRL